jgi:hypothetical protein
VHIHTWWQAVANVAWAAAVLSPIGPGVLNWVTERASHVCQDMCMQQSVQMYQYYLEYERRGAVHPCGWDALGKDPTCTTSSYTEVQVVGVLAKMGLRVEHEWREPNTGA